MSEEAIRKAVKNRLKIKDDLKFIQEGMKRLVKGICEHQAREIKTKIKDLEKTHGKNN